MKIFPDFSFEKIYWAKGHNVTGIDEVGRGAFAGPVTVAGVAFKNTKKDTDFLLSLGINDSKKLSPKKREELSKVIKEKALGFQISFIDVLKINKFGIGKTTFMAMKDVADKISSKIKNPFFLIDAFEIPQVSYPQKGIIRGDTLSISIAAASIIAKVARDKLMVDLAKDFPIYGFDQHKGYGTALHRSLILKNGESIHHRTQFCRRTLAS